jgi:metal-responsive CopG/Arc/MetJ family transcriptional regulator
MSQINIIVTEALEKDLKKYMQRKGITQKSEAIRSALHESVERLEHKNDGKDFRSWLGLGLLSPPNTQPKFKSEDDLWE